MANIAALAAELAAGHPGGDPYSADDTIARIQLYAENVERPVVSVTGQAIFEAVVPAHYNALSDSNKQLFGVIVGMGSILVNGTNTKAALVAMFSGATETLQALAALQVELVSQVVAKRLGQVGVGNIAQARTQGAG